MIIKKKSKPKKIESRSIILTERNNNKKILNESTQREINLVYLDKYFQFWKNKNVKKILLNRLSSIFLLFKYLSKKYFLFKKDFLNKIQNYIINSNINLNKKILIYDKLLKQNNSLRFNKRQSCKGS